MSKFSHQPGSTGPIKRTNLNQLLVLLCLTGFAITEPVLTIFGANPELFYFHHVDTPAWIGVYALIIALLPALSLWLITVASALFNKTLAAILHNVFVFFLGAIWLVQLARWNIGIEQPLHLAIIAAVGAAIFVVAYLKWPFVNAWLQIAAIAPLIVVGVFLISSDTGRSIRYNAPTVLQATHVERPPSVLFVLLDEFPSLALFDEQGIIDRNWFPNLAQLSEQATWYRHYSVLTDNTIYSVPSILTGYMPRSLKPSMVNFPNNLFTLLAPTHHLTAYEAATGLCKLPQCGEGPPGLAVENPAAQMKALLSKTFNLWRRQVPLLSDGVNRLEDFEEDLTTERVAPASPTPADPKALLRYYLNPANELGFAEAKPKRLNKFIQTLAQSEQSALYFIHLEMPHTPWRFYGNGQMYDLPAARQPFSPHNNDGGEWLATLSEYRFSIQAQYTDQLVGEIFSKLKSLGIWDDLLVVVTADHGRSFDFNTNPRRVSPETFDTLAYVPLFIKRPFQKRGQVDDSNLMAYDLLPTIADILDIEIPWPVMGLPATSADMVKRGDQKEFFGLANSKQMAIGSRLGPKQIFSDSENFPKYELRDIGELRDPGNSLALLNSRLGLDHFFGRSPDEFDVEQGGNAKVEDLEKLRNPTPDRAPLGVVMGNLGFEPAGDKVLISVNGRFVTGSPLVEFQQVKHTFIAMLPSNTLAQQNDIGVYLVEGNRLIELVPE